MQVKSKLLQGAGNEAKSAGNKPRENSNNGLEGKTVSYKEGQEALEKEERVLGFTLHFWILLATCIGGCVVCAAATVLSVAFATSNRIAYFRQVQFTETGRIQKPVLERSFVQRVIFRHDLNPLFAARSDMAARVAVVSAIFSLPYFVESLGWINDIGFSMQYAVVILCFTVYQDLGTTVSFAWYNFAGTVLPVLNALFMYGWYPQGSSIDGEFSMTWWIGFINFAVFIALMMVLKWPVGIRMFAVSWQAYFSMCFLNPNDTTHFSPGITNILLEGAAVGPLIGTVIGCVASVLCLCFWPGGTTLTALGSAQELAMEVAWSEGNLWRHMIKHYTGKERSVLVDKLQGECEQNRTRLNSLTGCLGANSWWECFDLGRTARIRAHLIESSKKLIFMHDWLRSAVLTMFDEEFEDQHDALMEVVAPQLTKLCDHTSRLLYRTTLAAAEGGVAPLGSTDPEILREDADKVMEAQAELAAAFLAARKQVYGSSIVSTDSISEHFFVTALSLYGQYATQFAEYMMDNKVTTKQTGILSSLYTGMMDMMEFTGWGFTMRSSIGFFLAFFVGYHGLADIILPFNGTPAGTTAYLMASDGAAGSAIMKNIARFQGTAGGSLLGQLIWGTVVWCSIWGTIGGVAAMFIFEYLSMFLYFSSVNFGYVGVLLGAYGAEHLMVGCQSGGDSAANVYSVMQEQMLAIVAVTIGDLLVGNTSPGIAATQTFYSMTETIQSGLREFFCLDRSSEVLLVGDGDIRQKTKSKSYYGFAVIKDVEFHRDSILGDYSMANFIGHEAPLEPRWYRTAWRENLWDAVVESSFKAGSALSVMEYAVWEGASRGLARRAMIVSGTMEANANRLLDRANKVFLLSQKMLTHENEGPLEVSAALTEKMMQESRLELTDGDAEKIISEVMGTLEVPDKLASLSEDDACQLAVVIQMMRNTMMNINQIQDKLFCQPELLAAKDNKKHRAKKA